MISKNIISLLALLVLTGLFFNACVPAFDGSNEEVNVDLSNKDVCQVLDIQDRHNLDSLYSFMASSNSTLSYLSTLAFASYQNKDALDSIIGQLTHPNLEVRSAAAYSLGQLKDERAEGALLEAFKNKDTLNVNNDFNANILEAIGKTSSTGLLYALATISTYRKSDTELLLGQARGIYRFALRGIVHPKGTERMVNFVTDTSFPNSVRLIAAHYLSRAEKIDISTFQFQLVKFFTSDPDPNIRMAVARALGKTQDKEIHSYLLNQLSVEKDYRVLINTIRALEEYPYIQSVDRILEFVKNDNLHLATTAVNFIINSGNSSDAAFYRTLISDSLDYRVNGKLYEAVFKNLPAYYKNTRKKIKEELIEKINATDNEMEAVAYLRAFANEPNSYELLGEIIKERKSNIIATTAMESMHSMLKSDHFIPTHKGRHLFKRKEIADLMLKEAKVGDSGTLAIIADMIIDQETKLSDIIAETSYLIEARNTLELPREIETYNKLEEAISILKKEEFVKKELGFNHPIDWTKLEGVTDTSVIIIKTNKGNIGLHPFPEKAPGSVANFISLSNSDFYDNKNFHRVVPNFVIQGGCPRGDGYGSLDYTIRSEFSPLYYDEEGYIGMASAGPNTEGTQFFITHSPTPHLDGRYTIFGKVYEGMEVVHDIQAGDKIIDVIISK